MLRPLVVALLIASAAKGPQGEFSIYVAPGALYGLAAEVQKRRQPFTLERAQLAKARESSFTYDFTLQLDALTDRVAVAVFDEVSKEFGLVTAPVPERKVQ